MKGRFVVDAARWEAREISLDEFDSRHPRRDVRALVDVASRIAAVTQEPTPSPEAEWSVLRNRLPERVAPRERQRSRVRRSLVPVLALLLIGGTSVAYAAGVEPIRHDVDRIVKTVSGFFTGDDGPANDSDQGNQHDIDTGTGTGNQIGGQGSAEDGGQGTSGPDVSDQGNQGSGQTSGDQGSVDQGSADQGNADRGNADRGNVDERNADQGSADQGHGGHGSADQGSADQGSADQGSRTSSGRR